MGVFKIKIIKSYNYYCFPLIIVVTSNITHLFLGNAHLTVKH